LLPPAPVLARCTNLLPFNAAEQRRWQTLWDGALAGA
jgi:putative spermidine/putrescine transport system substrate-binding protein